MLNDCLTTLNKNNMKFHLSFLILFTINITNIWGQSFTSVTERSGLNKSIHSNGIAVADYDLDGDLDVYIVGSDPYDPQKEITWNRFYSNNGNGTFSEVTEGANIRGGVTSPEKGSMGNQFGAAWGDYDNDGDPDLFLTNYGYNVLYKNNGNRTFTDITESAGVKGREDDHNSSACWWDYDLDGDLDLYVSAWFGENILYENLGDGIFTDVTEAAGLGDAGFTWSSVPIDANNDRLPDLYVVNDFGANTFYVNLGDKTFAEATEQFGLMDVGNGMGVDIGDYNNDGLFDIYLTNISSLFHCPLFENQGNGIFIDKAKDVGVSDAGWAWGTEFFDFDHDGGLDLYVVNGFESEPGNNFFFYNLLESDILESNFRKAFFWNVSEVSGANTGEEARSLVTFDYDDDGDLDLVVGNWWTMPQLFENQSQTKNWLKIELEGTVSNRNAFGATVSITCGEKKYYRSNDGIDFLGQSVLPLHFGVANAEMIDSVNVVWPTGESELITDVAINQTIKIIEREGLVTGVKQAKKLTPQPEFSLLGNYPNPFNGAAHIEFNLPEASLVQFKVMNILGHEIYSQTLSAKAGRNHISWQGRNMIGSPVGSGLYFYSITFKSNMQLTGKLLHIK